MATRELYRTTRFKKDLKRAHKRNKDPEQLRALLDLLLGGERLPERYRAHRLSGEWSGLWECHIEPDWLLVWMEDEESVTLIRTGSHADLFG